MSSSAIGAGCDQTWDVLGQVGGGGASRSVEVVEGGRGGGGGG